MFSYNGPSGKHKLLQTGYMQRVVSLNASPSYRHNRTRDHKIKIKPSFYAIMPHEHRPILAG